MKRKTKKFYRPCRVDKVLIGGFFDRWVQREFRLIAKQENVTIGDLVGEGVAAVLVARTPGGSGAH